jgi:ribonuclease VapC
LILDSSSVVSVLFKERGHERLAEAMAGAGDLGIGAPTLVETGMVMIGCMGLGARGLLARFLEQRRVLVIPFDDRHWNAAAQAFIRYGKGRHPAALNYGDCMTYATARIAGAPLLYAGEDFAKTDLCSALD